MAEQDRIELNFSPSIDPLIDNYLVSVGIGYNPYEMRRYCRREALRLNAKSDAELSLLGITRSDIPGHVLRHRLSMVPA
ncbi:MAG: hypothetical protein OIF40_09500 [Mangrovicoccus sp.]|nr:hypothetical protein [Mangrovicoccus sp.]